MLLCLCYKGICFSPIAKLTVHAESAFSWVLTLSISSFSSLQWRRLGFLLRSGGASWWCEVLALQKQRLSQEYIRWQQPEELKVSSLSLPFPSGCLSNGSVQTHYTMHIKQARKVHSLAWRETFFLPTHLFSSLPQGLLTDASLEAVAFLADLSTRLLASWHAYTCSPLPEINRLSLLADSFDCPAFVSFPEDLNLPLEPLTTFKKLWSFKFLFIMFPIVHLP